MDMPAPDRDVAVPPPPPLPPSRPYNPKPIDWSWIRNSVMFKMMFVVVIVLLLFVPLGQIHSLLEEREKRSEEVIQEVGASWGVPQDFVGPVLVLSYGHPTTFDGTTREPVPGSPVSWQKAYFVPDKLDIEVDIRPEIRYRGIYRVTLYSSELRVSGRFGTLDLAAAGIKPEQVEWSSVALSVAVSDLRGIREDLALQWNGVSVPFLPGTRIPSKTHGLTANLGGLPGLLLAESAEAGLGEFTFTLPLNGRDALTCFPMGKSTRTAMRAPWPSPSFQGGLLPENRTVTEKGFDAEWRTTWYGSDAPLAWSSMQSLSGPKSPHAWWEPGSGFGVNLFAPVDHYQLVERAVKYGFLFITLAFTAFFLFEVLGKRRIHPFQYALIGGALCLFYLALLALSELWPFDRAYLAGAGAAVFLVVFYCSGVLGGVKNGLRAGGLLALVYAFLYVVLRMQDWSLVAGTAGLFVTLFVLMALTRRVDWYAESKPRS